MNKLHVVIPIGISTPGTPVPEFLINSIESLQTQTFKDILVTVAADENIPDHIKQLLVEYNVNVEWFSPHSFFTKEGMWGKIFRCWEKYDSEYVAFLHYDDAWEASKAQNQIEFIEKNNLDGSWSSVYIIDNNNNIVSDESMRWTHFVKEHIGHFHPWLPHGVIVKKDSILNSGILEYREKWTAIFEKVFCTFLQKIKNIKKCNNAVLFWRDHSDQMTYTLRDENLNKNEREITKYDQQELDEDTKYVIEHIDWEAIKNLY